MKLPKPVPGVMLKSPRFEKMQFAIVFIFISTYVVRDLSLATSIPSFESNKFAAVGIAINVLNNYFFKVEDTQVKRVNRIGSKASLVKETTESVDKSLDMQKKTKKICFNFKRIHENGYTLLMWASYNGNIKAVEFLLALKSDVNDMTVYGETALTLASRQGHARIVDLLLQHGADFNLTILDGVNALMLASLYGHQDTVEVFLNYGADVNAETRLNISAFTMAIHKNHTNVVELYLKYNTRNNKQAIKKKTLENAFFHASIYGFPNIVKLFIKYNIYNTNNMNIGAFAALEKYQHSVLKVYFQHVDVNSIQYSNFTLLQYAAAKGDDVNVKFLLENMADINKVLPDREVTPLMFATERGHLSTVKILLKYRANVNYITNELFSALIVAIYNNNENIVETLLQHKADVNHRYNGEISALSFAVSEGSLEIVKLLLKYGADVNQVSNIRVSALMIAAEKGLDDIVKILLENKANVHIKEIEYERNALISASNKGRVGTVQLLLKHGARVDDVNVFGYTSLMAAAEQGHDLVVELLIKNRADVNKTHMRNVNALMLAVYSGRTSTVKLLLKHNARVNRIIVNLALKKRRVFIVKLLREKIKEKYIKRQKGLTLKQSNKNTKTTAFNQGKKHFTTSEPEYKYF
ncbi:ankyrin repeat domain-containing protein 50-like [Physella acuta]|uniref:ankyrin repeat domain-containing protein 50-like n=1 Tax=Physella acuta TaxID=109671 RepID=UPI0027DAF606|nr:ankyrin repeat domain-containing protein 50-like [Physella acuta]